MRIQLLLLKRIHCVYSVDLATILFSDFEMRCPQGKKNKLYKRAKLEKFAHYLMKDGLVSRLSVYENRECE